MYVKYLYVALLFLLFSCSQESTSLDVFKKHKISYEGKKVLSSDQSFSLFIPTSWSSKHESYKLKNIKANVKTYSPTNADGFISIVSAEKVISFHGSKSLLEDFNVFLDLIDQNEWTLVGSGKTNLLNYPAYFLHYKTDVGTPSETESIVFILESEEDGVFYYLNASGSQSGSLEKELATMVQIISSFNVIKK